MPVQEMENKSSEVQIIEFHLKVFWENFFSPQQEMTKIEKKGTKKNKITFFIKFEMMRHVWPCIAKSLCKSSICCWNENFSEYFFFQMSKVDKGENGKWQMRNF